MTHSHSTIIVVHIHTYGHCKHGESGRFHGGPSQLSNFVFTSFHFSASPLYNASDLCHCLKIKNLHTPAAMDRRRQVAARGGFKEELVFNDEEEAAEGDNDEDADEDYDVDSLLNMRPGDYSCGRRSVSMSTPFASGSSSSSGWMPVPQHRLPPPRAPQPMSICQVENCMADMSNAKQYHRRHKVCEFHAKAQIAVVAGLQQRFCQQCSRLQIW